MTILILSGPVGSGKTTYARALEEKGVVRFSIDEWMIRLYGHDMADDLRETRRARCRRLFLDMAQEIGAIGLDVVLDCGYSQRSHRDEARDRLTSAGLQVELVYFDVPSEERWRRLVARNRALPGDCYHVTRAMFDALDAGHDPPGPNEPVRIVASR